MNSTRKAFDRGLLAGVLLMLGALAIYWFVSGDNRGASTLREAAVAGQAVVGFGGALFLWLRYRRGPQEEVA